MLEDLVNGRRKREFLDKNGQWKWASVRKYLKQVNEFEELLLLLAQILRVSQVGGKRSLAYAPSMESSGTGCFCH